MLHFNHFQWISLDDYSRRATFCATSKRTRVDLDKETKDIMTRDWGWLQLSYI